MTAILCPDHEIIKWLQELEKCEEEECAKYSSTVVHNVPAPGHDHKYHYHMYKLELIWATMHTLLGIELDRKPRLPG